MPTLRLTVMPMTNTCHWGVFEHAAKSLFSGSRKGKDRYTSPDVESHGGRKTALSINMIMLHYQPIEGE